MSDIVLSLNLKKVNANTSVNKLVDEMTRDEKNAKDYEDGVRQIDVTKTKNNKHFYPKGTTDIDLLRKEIIKEANEKRANTKRLDKNGNEITLQKLRANAVDLVTGVIQLEKEVLEDLDENEVKKLYQHAVQEVGSDKDKYGDLLLASLHLDESVPHVQFISSVINDEGKSIANRGIMKGRHTLSKLQTSFSENVNERVKNDEKLNHLTVKRGKNRMTLTHKERRKLIKDKTFIDLNRSNEEFEDELYELSEKLDDPYGTVLNEQVEFKQVVFKSIREAFDRLEPEDYKDEDNTFLKRMGRKIKGATDNEEKFRQMDEEGFEKMMKKAEEGHPRTLKKIFMFYAERMKEREEELEEEEERLRIQKEKLKEEKEEMADKMERNFKASYDNYFNSKYRELIESHEKFRDGYFEKRRENESLSRNNKSLSRSRKKGDEALKYIKAKGLSKDFENYRSYGKEL